jgi:hypothetical protein
MYYTKIALLLGISFTTTNSLSINDRYLLLLFLFIFSPPFFFGFYCCYYYSIFIYLF